MPPPVDMNTAMAILSRYHHWALKVNNGEKRAYVCTIIDGGRRVTRQCSGTPLMTDAALDERAAEALGWRLHRGAWICGPPGMSTNTIRRAANWKPST